LRKHTAEIVVGVTVSRKFTPFSRLAEGGSVLDPKPFSSSLVEQ
jgi:hypothetical protein